MPSSADPRRERWVALAFGLLAGVALWYLLLGMRFEGSWPVRVYVFGPWVLAGSAFALGVFALWRAWRRPPLFQSGRMSGFFALAATIAVVGYPVPFPAAREGHPSTVSFALPVEGEWTVVWGGEDADANLLARTRADRRWGLDLLVTRDGVSHAALGERLEDYYAFGQPVSAPCAGRVVAAFGDEPDHASGKASQGAPSRASLGNYLVLDVAPGEFLFLANLRRGSLAVAVGDRVVRGQALAEVGHSSASRFTPEPHLALHLQDSARPRWAQGVPWRIDGYSIDGKQAPPGLPRGGVRGGRYVGERVRASER